MKLYKQRNVLSLGRVPTRIAICHRTTPSRNLLLILITNRKLRLCLWRFLCDAGIGYDAASAGAAGKPPMSLRHPETRQWKRLLLIADLFTGSLNRKPSRSQSQLHVINYSPVSTPMIYFSNIASSIL